MRRGNDSIRQRLRWLQERASSESVMTLIPKREYLARIESASCATAAESAEMRHCDLAHASVIVRELIELHNHAFSARAGSRSVLKSRFVEGLGAKLFSKPAKATAQTEIPGPEKGRSEKSLNAHAARHSPAFEVGGGVKKCQNTTVICESLRNHVVNVFLTDLPCIIDATGGGARTHTLLRVPDFESSASANSATPAQLGIGCRNRRSAQVEKWNTQAFGGASRSWMEQFTWLSPRFSVAATVTEWSGNRRLKKPLSVHRPITRAAAATPPRRAAL